MFGIKRPKSIDDKTWEKYQEDVTAKVLLLEKQGWPIESIKEFGKYFKEMLGRKVQSSNMSEIVASCYSDTQIVGTKAFDNMWYAWKADRISASESKKKLSVLMKITGMDKLDEKSSADQLRAVADKINKKMKPDDKFWGSLAGTVEKAYYPSGMKGDLGETATPVQVRNILPAGKVYSGQLQRSNRRRKTDKLYSQRENLELDSRGVYKATSEILSRFAGRNRYLSRRS